MMAAEAGHHKKLVALHELLNQDRSFLYGIRPWYLSHIPGEQNAGFFKEVSGENTPDEIAKFEVRAELPQ